MHVARPLAARPHCRTSSRRDRVFAAASAKPSAPIKVVGFGGCGVDYLASVAAYPKPDDKLRTEKLEVQGGGNCGNAITAMARLGLAATIVTKIGGDGLGDGIISELQGDGVSTQHILRAEGHPSPFTYIIVDRSGGTRTCIHTPGADFGPQELSETMLDAIVEGAALIYFDGRLTEAALKLAAYAKAKGVQLLVEAERLRPNLDKLLQLADYVVTSAHFPQDWTGESTLEDAVLSTALRLPAARMVLTTMGARGAVLLERAAATEAPSSAVPVPIASVVRDLKDKAEAARPPAGAQPDCVSVSGVAIQRGGVAETPAPVVLTYSRTRDASTAAAQVQAAGTRAAALNADADNSARYSTGGSSTATLEAAAAVTPVLLAKVTFATIASLPKEKVVDTTGAGDSFIGATVYGIVSGLSGARTMQLAAVVAACKCTALGARPGLPHASSLEPSLL